MYEPASILLYKRSLRTQRIYTFTHYINTKSLSVWQQVF